MTVIHCRQFNLAKKLPPLFIMLFCLTFLSACDSSNYTSNNATIDTPSEPKEEPKEKIGIVHCAP